MKIAVSPESRVSSLDSGESPQCNCGFERQSPRTRYYFYIISLATDNVQNLKSTTVFIIHCSPTDENEAENVPNLTKHLQAMWTIRTKLPISNTCAKTCSDIFTNIILVPLPSLLNSNSPTTTLPTKNRTKTRFPPKWLVYCC